MLKNTKEILNREILTWGPCFFRENCTFIKQFEENQQADQKKKKKAKLLDNDKNASHLLKHICALYTHWGILSVDWSSQQLGVEQRELSSPHCDTFVVPCSDQHALCVVTHDKQINNEVATTSLFILETGRPRHRKKLRIMPKVRQLDGA